MNIAHENYFYAAKELLLQEKQLINNMVIKNTTGIQKEINIGWLNLYCAPFDLADEVVRSYNSIGLSNDRTAIDNNQEFKNWNIESIERLHGQIEGTALQYMERIRQNDLSFWENEEPRDQFSFYLCNQYFRTKRMRDIFIATFEEVKATIGTFKDIRPRNMWLPLSLIFASNVGVHVAHNFSAVLLQSEDNRFIVGDQPVVNTLSTYNTSPTKDMEFFYPITPYTALLCTKNPKYVSGQTIKVNANTVDEYNALELRVSGEQSFAKDKLDLEKFVIA